MENQFGLPKIQKKLKQNNFTANHFLINHLLKCFQFLKPTFFSKIYNSLFSFCLIIAQYTYKGKILIILFGVKFAQALILAKMTPNS